METVGVNEAKTRFSELIARVSRGERITIARRGVPVAVLAPVESSRAKSPDEAIAALKALRRGRRLGDVSTRELIDEGRE